MKVLISNVFLLFASRDIHDNFYLSPCDDFPTDTHKTETESVKDKNVELAHQGKQCSSLNFIFVFHGG